MSQVARFVITLVTTAILARILSPEEFGLVAMVMAFTTIAASFRDMGLTTATVQSSNINHEQVSSLFWINFLFGIFLCIAVTATSPVIAFFYGEPRVTSISCAFATTFVIAGLGAQHQAILRRQMRFAALSAIVIGASTISCLMAIGAAKMGASYWSLVLMHVGFQLGTTVGFWSACRWRPSLPSRAKGMRALLSFGGYMAGVSLIHSLIRTVDKVILGYASGAGQIGLYNRAYNLLIIPLLQVADPITNVAVAAMSRLQNDFTAFRSFFRKGVLLILSLTVPFVAFTFVSTESLVYTLLGEQWTSSIQLLRLLCPAAFVITLRPSTLWVYASTGQARRQFFWGVVAAPVIFLFILVGMQWGAAGVAVAFSSALLLTGLSELPYCFRTTPIKLSDFGFAMWRPVTSSIIAAGLLRFLFIPLMLETAYWVQLISNLLFFGFAYSLSWLVLPGGIQTAKDILELRKRTHPSIPS